MCRTREENAHDLAHEEKEKANRIKTNIDATDLACILAGLRLLQREMGYGYDVGTMCQFTESDPPLQPPDSEYLDELCERINTSDLIEIVDQTT